VRDFYGFFAGGGMARAGLGGHWVCRFANDFDPKKAASYAANWGDKHLKVGDVAKVRTARALPISCGPRFLVRIYRSLAPARDLKGSVRERSGPSGSL
jgi:site-specific DNA-cytosine methylase